MTTILNVLFTVVALLFFAGRLYEIIGLTDVTTGFLTGKAVVTSPFMMIIILVMAVCIGVIMFAGETESKKMKKMPVGIFGYVSGFFFIAGGVISSVNCFRFGGFIGYHIMEILGGVGLILLGMQNLRGKKSERIPMVLIILLCVGVCLNAMVYEIKTVQDTEFMMRTLTGVTSLLFFTTLFKNAIVSDKTTKMLLYISARVNFVIAGAGGLAAVAGNFVTGMSSFPQQLYNVGFAVLGIYSLFVAFLISPQTVAQEESEQQPVREYRPKKKAVPQPEPEEYEEETGYMTTGNIDKAAIEMLFRRKDEKEKQREDNYRAVKEEQQHIEHTQPVQIKKTVQTPVYTEERTAVIERPAETGRAVYKGDGKKKSTQKIVYKAPK